jgi:uncharacterized glyoxalase superfamily protein PhnB
MTLHRTLILLWALFSITCGGEEPRGAEPTEGEMSQTTAALPEILATNVFYYYRDVERAWGFYTETLGFHTVADYGFAKILQVGPTSYLTLVDENEGMHSSTEPKSVTLAVITDEVEAWWEYLSEAGVEMRAPLGQEEGRPHDGFVAIDPEGYFLEFERFNPHPENEDLLPILSSVSPLFPDGTETAPGVIPKRPPELGVRGTVFWLYYQDLDGIQGFYRDLLGVDILVDQGWAKVYPASLTGFLGFVDGERGLHQATEEKAVTVAFFTTFLEEWLEHARGVEGFVLRTQGVSSEGDFVRTFVGYDLEGYFLEWDEFLDVEVNRELLRSMGEGVGSP